MIYPDISAQDWIKRYPSLEILALRLCEKHNLNINLAVPFITNELIGLSLDPNNLHKRDVKLIKADKKEKIKQIILDSIYKELK